MHRRDELRASKIMQDRALANPKIEFKWNSEVERRRRRAARSTRSSCATPSPASESELEVQGLFVAIGHDPNTALFTGQLDLDENGYIVTEPDSTRTSVEGVFAAGDVQDHVYRQAITAAGSGCMAAIEAERWLGEARARGPRTPAAASDAGADDRIPTSSAVEWHAVAPWTLVARTAGR